MKNVYFAGLMGVLSVIPSASFAEVRDCIFQPGTKTGLFTDCTLLEIPIDSPTEEVVTSMDECVEDASALLGKLFDPLHDGRTCLATQVKFKIMDNALLITGTVDRL
jgi:hypothetical protein